MARLAIYLPSYKRPTALIAVAKNLEAVTNIPFKLYFGLEKDDELGIGAARSTGHEVVINKGLPGYADTIQAIYEQDNSEFFLHANDDFMFHSNWTEIPLSMFERADLMVVGLRQTEGDAHGSAISLVRRRYIEQESGVVDIPNRVFYPYNHNYVDTEFTRTAQARGVWAPCDVRVITHLHPGFTGAEKDETYLKNEKWAEKDKQTFESRQHLWAAL